MTLPTTQKPSVPGPRSQKLLALWQQHVPDAVARTTPIFAGRTEGATLIDVDGNRYIDFAGGIGVLNVGANHPEVVQAVQEQASQYLHTCAHVALYEPYVRLAAELNRLTPGRFAKKTVLLNSGAEAVENAIKIARKYTGRPAIISMTNAFHGRTLLGMSLTGKVHPYKHGYGPFAPEVYRAPFPYPYRMPQYGDDPEACARGTIAELERIITSEVGADKVAAVIAEPVQGEGGFIVPPDSYFPMVADLCRRHGILLIADEIQTGFARTGKMYAVEHWGVEPDLILSAKSLGGGMPISAVTGRAEILDAVHVGGLGGTYGGNPLACAAALKVIEIMERDDYPAKAAAIGRQVYVHFKALQEDLPVVGEVRGLGAMVAMELVSNPEQRTPNPELTAKLVQYAYENGLILLKAGSYGNVIRFLAPLSITAPELQEGLDILAAGLRKLA